MNNPITEANLVQKHRDGKADYYANQYYCQYGADPYRDSDKAGVCKCAGSVVIDRSTGIMNINMGTDKKEYNMWVRLSSDDLLVMLKHAIEHEKRL